MQLPLFIFSQNNIIVFKIRKILILNDMLIRNLFIPCCVLISGEAMPKNLRLLEKLELVIPGFKGYKEKELRREEDKALRMRLVRALEDLKYDLVGMEEEYSDELEKVKTAEALLGRIQKLEDTIEHADYGYAGFFDLNHIDEEKLDEIYEHDLAMFDLIDNVNGEENLEVLKKQIRKLEKKWDEREEICML
jgi:hypothetical protein